MAQDFDPIVKLTPEQLADLKASKPYLDAMLKEIERAERAGLDVSDHRQLYERYKALADGVLKEYGRPSRVAR